MKLLKKLAKQRDRRRFRVRNRVRKTGRLRLTVFRSNRHIYAQVIDDSTGTTLVSASTVESALGGAAKPGADVESAAAVGKLVAERALAKGLKQVTLDRGGYQYHGRVAALATAAREAGLDF